MNRLLIVKNENAARKKIPSPTSLQNHQQQSQSSGAMTLLSQCLLGSLLLFILLLTRHPHRALSPKNAVEFSHCHLESHPSFSKVYPFPEPVCKSQRLGRPIKALQPRLLPSSPTFHFLNLRGPRMCPCTPGSLGAALRPGSKW